MNTLDALLDTLIPGNAVFPSARSVDIAAWLEARASRFGPALTTIIEALPVAFSEQPAAQRETMVRAVEAHHPDAFSTLLTGVYSGYYTSPAVLKVIEAETGYAARPPQPLGHDLAPFDPASVAIPAGRPPSWRPA